MAKYHKKIALKIIVNATMEYNVKTFENKIVGICKA